MFAIRSAFISARKLLFVPFAQTAELGPPKAYWQLLASKTAIADIQPGGIEVSN
jgi:hypothetical protein